MTGFKLDTSGTVTPTPDTARGFTHGMETAWSDLTYFAQGYVEAMCRANFEAVALLPSDNDENGQCRWCGRDNVGYEKLPCSDDCARQDWHFSDLAPATLARIIEDCERWSSLNPHHNGATDGRYFWETRASGERGWTVLTPYLGDDGLIYLREAV